jgi:bifunctional ADP-heptose synthase (sugar kinase/adenylyltransferase)
LSNLKVVENYLSKQAVPENLLAAPSSSSSSVTSIVEVTQESIGQDHKLFSKIDDRIDNVYTVGCFDLFHYGHIHLFERMGSIGKTLIVGVHDSRR